MTKNLWTRVVRAAAAAALFMAMRELEAQQLDYSRTALIHGFGSSSAMWTTGWSDLGHISTQQYLTQRVDLGSVLAPSWSPQTVFQTEWQEVRDRLVNDGQRTVLVGHSLGGLVSRYTYLQGGQTARDQTAAILTVASPHQGVILADSTAQLGAFMHDFKVVVNRGIENLKLSLVGLVTAVLYPITGGASSYLLAALFINFPEVSAPDQLLTVATIPTLRTTSGVISQLNSSGNFDSLIPRANVIGRLDNNKFMPIKLAAAFTNKSEQSMIDDFQKSRSALNTCKWVMAFTIIGISAANKCGDAERMMGRLDETWQRYASGSSPQQKCGQVWTTTGPITKCWTIQAPNLNIYTDGVVPNSRSVYPSQGAGQFWQAPTVVGVNHLNIYKRVPGVDRMVEAMRDQFRMRTPPPSGGGGLSVSLTGPTSIGHEETGTWQGSASNAQGSTSCSWSVDDNVIQTGSCTLGWWFGTPQTWHTISVTVSDGVNSPGSQSLNVWVYNSGCTSQCTEMMRIPAGSTRSARPLARPRRIGTPGA